jgi:hypothetical protein
LGGVRQGAATKFPWELPRIEKEVCGNTCPTALNGLCEEGRHAVGQQAAAVRCDLGTDCGDCGPWRSVVAEGLRGDTPIKRLKDKGVSMCHGLRCLEGMTGSCGLCEMPRCVAWHPCCVGCSNGNAPLYLCASLCIKQKVPLGSVALIDDGLYESLVVVLNRLR